MRKTGLERAAPKVDVGLELLMDFGAELGVIKALVDVERQHAPLIRRLVISSEGANRDGVRHKSVSGIPRDVRRRPENRENSHGRPPFSVGHLRQIDERRNGALAERRLSGLNLTVQ